MEEVFTAVGNLGRVPSGLLEGIILVLYKNRGLPESYWPVTLLCTDYHDPVKVLTNRLGLVLGWLFTLN